MKDGNSSGGSGLEGPGLSKINFSTFARAEGACERRKNIAFRAGPE